jgi:hypothetical protein
MVIASALLGGCIEAETPKIAPWLVESVEVSRREPGPYCEALGALEGTSDMDDENDEDEDAGSYAVAYASLRSRAALRGGNYVVIDQVRGPHLFADSTYSRATVIAGRVYFCGVGTPFAFQPPAPPPAAPGAASDTEVAGRSDD